jgi:hypothetical protein
VCREGCGQTRTRTARFLSKEGNFKKKEKTKMKKNEVPEELEKPLRLPALGLESWSRLFCMCGIQVCILIKVVGKNQRGIWFFILLSASALHLRTMLLKYSNKATVFIPG